MSAAAARLSIVINDGRDRRGAADTDDDSPRGGIGSAALGLGTALARRGHDVHLFVQRSQPSRGEVTIHERAELYGFAGAREPDVLVLIPEVLPLLMPLPARARVVWTGNAFKGGDCALAVQTDGAGTHTHTHRKRNRVRLYSMATLFPRADLVVAKSRWQAAYMAERHGIPAAMLRVLHNGVPLEHYAGERGTRHRHRLVYASQARRGLDVLLSIFTDVRAAVPDAELHVFGYEDPPSDLPATQDGVHWRGQLGKRALAEELCSAAIMAYPNTLKETFCTAVAEAQAAGLPVVTSDRAALGERVVDGRDGFLVGGSPESAEYRAAFTAHVVRLLRDDALWQAMSLQAARKARSEYDWSCIAAAWERELGDLTAGRQPAPPALDPRLDLRDRALLVPTEPVAGETVSPELATAWLESAWTSYGCPLDTLPLHPIREGAPA